MKSSEESGKFPKYVLDEVYSSLGDVSHVRSIGQIPRRPQDMCNARRSIPSQKVGSIENTVVKLDRIWMLLERARWEEENSLQEKFIRECCIHPDFLVVQANDLQLQELEHICTNPSEFCQCIQRYDLINSDCVQEFKFSSKKTGKPLVFIGPVLLHQNSERKTFSKFSHCLITEQPSLPDIQAHGSDGQKALTDLFKRNFQFTFGLRCFRSSYQKGNSMVSQKVILCLKYLVNKKEN